MATRFKLPHTRWSTECTVQSCGSIHPLFKQKPQALQPSCTLPSTHCNAAAGGGAAQGGQEPRHVGHSHLQVMLPSTCSISVIASPTTFSSCTYFPFTLILDNGQAKQQECHSNTVSAPRHPLPAEHCDGCITSLLTLSKPAAFSEQPTLIRTPVPIRP